jgi:hypothetical protein
VPGGVARATMVSERSGRLDMVRAKIGKWGTRADAGARFGKSFKHIKLFYIIFG